MTSENQQTGDLTPDELPYHQVLLGGTAWASLGTARGNGGFLSATLPRLLDADPTVQIRAISELEPVCHQNSFYEATLPVALYVAAILAHPATAAVGPARRADSERDCPVRASLLDWLGSLAYDADDECLAIAERHFDGDDLDDYPEMRVFLDHRPTFYGAVSAFLGHEDTAVREAAVVAAIPLTEHPALIGHRDELGRRIHRLLATSTNRYNRNRCLDALKNWGYDIAAVESPADVAARVRYVRDVWTGGCTEEPPF
ncbi:hypothetical protein HEP85_25315 [Streptomyces sp. RPA4-2]|uniref:hypothetical protein n=1 Tax=Streptomyces sp. RPA4-2 TaxID=2721244 RepID=UPI00143E71FC|nr:hypothetical protein [Streptomyces sp. RPA4-2]QIY64326.1 hypothetical protein HEP85_25315 [Streptomyces sp. RPA4-2]